MHSTNVVIIVVCIGLGLVSREMGSVRFYIRKGSIYL